MKTSNLKKYIGIFTILSYTVMPIGGIRRRFLYFSNYFKLKYVFKIKQTLFCTYD